MAGAKDGTCFLIGNGPTKRLVDIDALATKGVIFGCNLAFQEHRVDFLGFMDSRVLNECLHFPGAKFIPWRQYFENERALLKQHNNRNLWFFKYAPWKPGVPWPQDADKSTIHEGLTGFHNAQIALILGFKRLVFVGYDYDADEPNKAISHAADLEKMDSFKYYAQRCGAEVFTIDGQGALDYPTVYYTEVMKWKDL